jgi:hypothetical protein
MTWSTRVRAGRARSGRGGRRGAGAGEKILPRPVAATISTLLGLGTDEGVDSTVELAYERPCREQLVVDIDLWLGSLLDVKPADVQGRPVAGVPAGVPDQDRDRTTVDGAGGGAPATAWSTTSAG